jgi:hypothetical protein
MIPVGYKTYYLDLDKTNQQDQPHWELLHDFKSEYGLSDLSPDSLRSELAEIVLNDEQAAMKYLWNRNKKAPSRKPTSCDQECRLELYCEMVTTDYFA